MAQVITLGDGLVHLDYGEYTLKTRGRRFRVLPIEKQLPAGGDHHSFDPFLRLPWLRNMVMGTVGVELVEKVEVGVRPARYVLHLHNGLFCLVENPPST